MNGTPSKRRPKSRFARAFLLRAGVYGTLTLLTVALLVLPGLLERAVEEDWRFRDWLPFPDRPLPRNVKTIRMGEEMPALLDAGERDAWFRLQVPDDTVKLRVELESSEEVDLDIHAFACSDSEVRAGTEVLAHSKRDAARESLRMVDPSGTLGGEYTLRVSAPLRREAAVAFKMIAYAESVQQGPDLLLDRWTEVTLANEGGKTTLFHFELTEPADELHVQIAGARTDYDIFADLADDAHSDEWDWRWTSPTIFNDEWLVIAEDTSLDPGRYKLLIEDTSWEHDDDALDDRIQVGLFTSSPPPPPKESAGGSPDARTLPGLPPSALQALVHLRVERGHATGVVISPKGHILTAAHAFEESEKEPGSARDDFAVVGFVDDLSLQPTQSYVAELLHVDRDRDLALAKIVRTVRQHQAESTETNTNLPEFAYLGVDFDELPLLGEPVTALGFPSISSSQQRSFLHLTRGVVTSIVGDHRPPRYAMIDAQTFPGMSGGPVIDSRGRVVGLVSFSRTDPWDAAGRIANYFVLSAGFSEGNKAVAGSGL